MTEMGLPFAIAKILLFTTILGSLFPPIREDSAFKHEEENRIVEMKRQEKINLDFICARYFY
jgi:hypothetical protein